jgi:hypothetical protein
MRPSGRRVCRINQHHGAFASETHRDRVCLKKVRLSTGTSSAKRRFLVTICGVLLMGGLSVLAVFVYYSFSGFPEDLFFRRTDRRFCINCGSQSLSYTTTILGGIGRQTDPRVIERPKINGIDPFGCKHDFQVIAAQDRYIDFGSLRMKRWGFGKIEGDPIWSETAVVLAFANLSRTNIQDSGELFSYLLAQRINGQLSGRLLEAVSGTNADEVVSALYQSYTNHFMLSSQKRSKK